MSLRIAVISDLHCHNKSQNKGVQESYILTDEIPLPNLDPILSFEHLVSESNKNLTAIQADILLMPGDLTNKVNIEGLIKGWEVTKKIGFLLKAEIVIPTIGNHDVDSRLKYSSDAFQNIKSFSPDFPFLVPGNNEEFWNNGFVFISGEDYRILVLNSSFKHINHEQAQHGLISQEAVNKIEEKLDSFSDTKKYNIAICHHHPIPHERNNLGSSDIMHNGTELIELLEKHDFQLIVHGHKHDPRIRYAAGGANSPLVFAAGSFSAFKNLLLQGAYNTFHLITIEADRKKDCVNQGLVNTWFFVPSKGWKSNVNNEFIPSVVGFGCRTTISDLASNILNWFNTKGGTVYEWREFIMDFEMISYLIPSDRSKLAKLLKKHQISTYPSLPEEPQVISFKK